MEKNYRCDKLYSAKEKEGCMFRKIVILLSLLVVTVLCLVVMLTGNGP